VGPGAKKLGSRCPKK